MLAADASGAGLRTDAWLMHVAAIVTTAYRVEPSSEVACRCTAIRGCRPHAVCFCMAWLFYALLVIVNLGLGYAFGWLWLRAKRAM
jgi:hypothetical protein